MIDLTKIDTDTRIARGDYATVNSAIKDGFRNLQMLHGEATSAMTKALRQVQPDDASVPQHPTAQLALARAAIEGFDATATSIISLTQQKHDLRAQAWGKKP